MLHQEVISLLGVTLDSLNLYYPLACRCKPRYVPKKQTRSVLFWQWRSWSRFLMILMSTNPLVC